MSQFHFVCLTLSDNLRPAFAPCSAGIASALLRSGIFFRPYICEGLLFIKTHCSILRRINIEASFYVSDQLMQYLKWFPWIFLSSTNKSHSNCGKLITIRLKSLHLLSRATF